MKKMNYIICSLASGTITALCFLYYFKIVKPVKYNVPDKPRDMRHEWIDFIHANIRASFTKYHCLQCQKMIVLFDKRFRQETPPEIINDWVSQLYDRLDTRYKTLCTEDDRLSNMTSEEAMNIIG